MKTLEYYLSLPYRLEIIPDAEEGGYGARYPELPGCITCAETLQAVVVLAEDAKREWLMAALADGVEIPEPEPVLQTSA
ncbi:MAG: type II toxin-antitoxin system HicB family antitoxin [Lachnospiraceae bacterium]|nr:type II toxin-antitoxin system HicB family antitoxin [Lachnospiraceae bacterium]